VKIRTSRKAGSFAESVIREMTRIAMEHESSINLGQGFPDFPAPEELKRAAAQAIDDDHNQYPITWGVPAFREAVATTYAEHYAIDVDPATEICITCGSTEAVMASFLGIVDDGDEVVLFEPYYEAYGPDSILAGATRRFVTLHAPTWTFDPDELRAAFGARTRVIVVNSPHNPTGKVFTREELTLIADLCIEHDAIAITDEIYEHITYDGREHIPIATLPGMRERTVTVSALSKTYSVTGWRVGWAIAEERLMHGIRATHDFMTVGAATPLQHAGIVALGLGAPYLSAMLAGYEQRRRLMMSILADAGFAAVAPEGAYYVMADISPLGFADDWEAAMHLVKTAGIATVPGSSFFSEPGLGAHLLRFAFCKRLETLEAAGERLRALG
jgi:aminotransferase